MSAAFRGGETIFREKWTKRPGAVGNADEAFVSWGALNRTALTAREVVPVCRGTMIADDDDHFTIEERRGKLVRDLHPDEHGTCHIVKGRRLARNIRKCASGLVPP